MAERRGEQMAAAARAVVDVRWTPDRAERVRRGLPARRRARALRRGAAVTVSAAAVALLAVGVLRRGGGASLGPDLRLDDGSRATAIAPATRLHVLERAGGRAVLALERGAARFDVRHDP